MSEVNFKSLQAQHESLLQRQQGVTNENQQDFTKAVREFIEQAKQGGSHIASTRERDQVRANLRYWANYIYGIEGVFPDTELAPSTVTGSQSFWAGSLGKLTLWGLALVIVIGAGSYLFGGRDTSTSTEATETPVIASPTTSFQPTSTSEPISPADATPTSAFDTLVLVALTGPENGANVLPRVQFTGVSANLDAEDSIHLLIVREDLFFPIREFVAQEQVSATGEWTINASLYRDEKELELAENLIVVPAVCFDQQCRDTLANAVQTGITISPLPPQLSFNSFNVYRDSSRVFYRNAYQAVHETRVVYSIFYEGRSSFDLYTSQPDGSDVRQITQTSDVSELFPNLSPDGTKMVYVKRFKDPNGNGALHAIAIMNSNGENEVEITARTKNVLESPQWSPDSTYISYALGNTSRSANATYWSIHVYNSTTGEDKDISGESGPHILNRYHSWIPDSNDIVFNSVAGTTGTSGFIRASIDNQGTTSVFYDTAADEIQPSIYRTEAGYILTYATIDPDTFLHNVFAVIDSDQQFPLDGSPVRLTYRRSGEIVGGVRTASATFPIPDPDSNSIYYIRNENIYRLEFMITAGEIEILPGSIDDGERNGDVVIETGLNDEIIGFDVGYMEAFFPIFLIP
jgi:hypothetical protein